MVIVDDEAGVRRAVQRVLRGSYRVIPCEGGHQALEVVEQQEVAVLLTDFCMPQMSGLELLGELVDRHPDSPTVRMVVSARTDFEGLQAFINHCRISHFIAKPFDAATLREAVDKAAAEYRKVTELTTSSLRLARENEQLSAENERLRHRRSRPLGFDRIIGKSLELQRALALCEQVRRSEVTVHLQGETGTGKELVARALHEGGPRSEGSFVAQNCAGLESTLLQATLFGHRKGAFTGADEHRPGVFQQAHRGTLFLDEVAELTLPVQAALLRALQDGEVFPVGETRPEKVDIRLISATHVDLRQEVAKGRFREDLYFRLVVVALELPPLRQRDGDVPILLRHFLELYGAKHGKRLLEPTPEVMAALERYPWPGNVRELANEVERLVVLCRDGSRPAVEHLSRALLDNADSDEPTQARDGFFIPYGLSYDEARNRLACMIVERAMEESGGVVRAAADALRMERSRLAKLRRRLASGPPAYASASARRRSATSGSSRRGGGRARTGDTG